MLKPIVYIVLFLCCVMACKTNTEAEVEEEVNTVEQDVTINSIGEQLIPDADIPMRDWKDFQFVASKMESYTAITSGQALENAKDLSDLVRKISDTIRVDLLERPDFRARLNVLYSHSLRLHDMSTIPSISEEEVNGQVTKLLEAFSSIINKINAIYKQEKSEKEFMDQSIKGLEISTEKTDPIKPEKPSLVDPIGPSQ